MRARRIVKLCIAAPKINASPVRVWYNFLKIAPPPPYGLAPPLIPGSRAQDTGLVTVAVAAFAAQPGFLGLRGAWGLLGHDRFHGVSVQHPAWDAVH